jgi:hypothetical protein
MPFRLLLFLLENERTIGGYNYSVANYSALNGIIENYNAPDPSVSKAMNTFSGLHGLNFGAQYRFGFYWVEFMWFNRFGKVSDVVRPVAGNSSTYSNTLSLRNQSFALGTAAYYQWFAIGGSVDWNITTIKHERSFDGISDLLLDDANFSLHVFANFELPPLIDGLSVNVRPYLHWPATQLGFQNVARKLMPSTTPNLRANYNQRIVNFGISFMLVHGSTCR